VSDGDSGGIMKLMLAIENQFMSDPKFQVIEKTMPG
jgi:hypothetical protein